MNKVDKSKQKDKKIDIIVGISFVYGTFFLALCYNLFLNPNKIVVGGMTGLGMIVENMTGFNATLFIYISSIILLVVAWIFLGKEQAKRVMIGSLMYPLFISFTRPFANSIMGYFNFEEILVTVVLAGLLYGVSNGIIYKYGNSTGGSDVIVKLLCNYLHFSEGKSLLIINSIILLMGAYNFGVDTAVYAIIIIVINSLIVDKISIGISDSKKFMIYTRESRKVKDLISNEFYAGYTIFPTAGGYSHIRGIMIMCVIRNRDVNLFKERILNIDPTAFFVISDCYEVQGGVKRSNLPFI